MEQLYVFSYQPKYEIQTQWTYDPIQEYQRMGIGSSTNRWRFSKINQNFQFCPTYPSLMIVPERITDNVLKHTGKFRSKSRIPCLSYIHKNNHITITRSSQPLVGLNKNRSIQDEKLIETIFNSGLVPPVSGKMHLIIDARPLTNAMAQMAMGAGMESSDVYKGSKIIFLGIENIHVVRDSFNRLMDVMNNDPLTLTRSVLERTGWMKHIKTILDGASVIVQHVHLYNAHVLIHCSDGWDRTAQLSCLAQVCLDPYFRTIQGLYVLIEKEWCHFGHKFKDRCGHLSRESFANESSSSNSVKSKLQTAGKNVKESLSKFLSTNPTSTSFGNQLNSLSSSEISTVNNLAPKEVSPIFVQFLDALYQIIRQFPNRFEYNDKLIALLMIHVYSCQFTTFLFNNEKEKVEFTLSGKKIQEFPSLWDYISCHLHLFRNPTFTDQEQVILNYMDPANNEDILYPLSSNLKFWLAELMVIGGPDVYIQGNYTLPHQFKNVFDSGISSIVSNMNQLSVSNELSMGSVE